MTIDTIRRLKAAVAELYDAHLARPATREAGPEELAEDRATLAAIIDAQAALCAVAGELSLRVLEEAQA